MQSILKSTNSNADLPITVAFQKAKALYSTVVYKKKDLAAAFTVSKHI